MNKEINYNYKLPPFKWFCLTNFPFIEADFDALTYYELLCKVVQYLNEVIVKTNAIGEQTEELTNAFNELKNYVDTYFDNLDVQEEINNKLDDMAEKGELADIISQYLNSTAIFGFDNVASMKSATNLVNGSYAKTLGYYAKNDGGQGLYKIRNVTNQDVEDDGSIIALDNTNLVAELIILNNEIHPEQFGCYGDGVTDDSTPFTTAFNYAMTHDFVFKAKKTYKTSSALNLTGNYKYLEINSVIYNGNGNFLIIKGCYNDIKINKLVGSTGISQGAIVLQAEYNTILNAHNKIEFDYIDGFNKGIYLDGETTNSYGIQYNEIKGGMINLNTVYGIYLGISSNQTSCWINQNYFDKIRTNNIYCIYMNNNKGNNSMNSNIFNEIGVEPDLNVDTLYGIYNKNTRDNRFLNCRASEINTNEILINEIDTSVSYPNIYDFTQIIPINKLNMKSGILKSGLASENNQYVLSQIGAKFFDDGSYLLLDNEWKKTGRIYNSYNADLDLTASNRLDVGYDMIYRFGADANGNYIVKLNKANIDRSVVKVRIGNLPGGTFTMKVVDANNNELIPTGQIDSTGVWTIERESLSKWYVYK